MKFVTSNDRGSTKRSRLESPGADVFFSGLVSGVFFPFKEFYRFKKTQKNKWDETSKSKSTEKEGPEI